MNIAMYIYRALYISEQNEIKCFVTNDETRKPYVKIRNSARENERTREKCRKTERMRDIY